MKQRFNLCNIHDILDCDDATHISDDNYFNNPTASADLGDRVYTFISSSSYISYVKKKQILSNIKLHFSQELQWQYVDADK